MRTRNPQPRHDQFHRYLENRQIADPPLLTVVDLSAQNSTTAATSGDPRHRPQPNHAPAFRPSLLFPPTLNFVTFPAAQPGNNVVRGHRSPSCHLMLRNTKIAVATGRSRLLHANRRRTFFVPGSSRTEPRRSLQVVVFPLARDVRQRAYADVRDGACRRNAAIEVSGQARILAGAERAALSFEIRSGTQHPATRFDSHRRGTVTEMQPVEVARLVAFDRQRPTAEVPILVENDARNRRRYHADLPRCRNDELD